MKHLLQIRCRRAIVGLAVVLSMVQLGTTAHADEAIELTPTPQPAVERFGEFGWIDTELRQVRPPNDQTLIVRGKLHNPYDVPIVGVRFIVRLLTAGEAPRELVRIEHEIRTTIRPGESIDFNRELATSYSRVFRNIAVVAFAIERGGQEMPVPPTDLVIEAGNARQVAYHTGDVPAVNSMIGNPGFAY